MKFIMARCTVLAGLGGALAMPALAQGRFPDRPIRMMVPWTPGGATDIQMRALCEQAVRRLGQPIIVENKPGAGGSLAAQFLAREAPLVGIDWVTVPFRGAAPNLQALLAGDIHFSAESSAWADMALERRVRPLSVWMSERAARFPDVPTLREVGYDVLVESTYGIGGPRGMDPGVVRALHDAFKEALFDPAHLAVIGRFDMPVRYLTSADYAVAPKVHYEDEKQTVQELG